MKRVLFICVANTNRSAMAEYLCRLLLARRLDMGVDQLGRAGWSIGSAGIDVTIPGSMSDPALRELARRGIDGASHRASRLTEDLAEAADVLLVMSEDLLDRVVTKFPSVVGRAALLDPTGRPIQDFYYGSDYECKECADHLQQAIVSHLDEWLSRGECATRDPPEPTYTSARGEAKSVPTAHFGDRK